MNLLARNAVVLATAARITRREAAHGKNELNRMLESLEWALSYLGIELQYVQWPNGRTVALPVNPTDPLQSQDELLALRLLGDLGYRGAVPRELLEELR